MTSLWQHFAFFKKSSCFGINQKEFVDKAKKERNFKTDRNGKTEISILILKTTFKKYAYLKYLKHSHFFHWRPIFRIFPVSAFPFHIKISVYPCIRLALPNSSRSVRQENTVKNPKQFKWKIPSAFCPLCISDKSWPRAYICVKKQEAAPEAGSFRYKILSGSKWTFKYLAR